MKKRVYMEGGVWVWQKDDGFYAHCVLGHIGPIKTGDAAIEAAHELDSLFDSEIPDVRNSVPYKNLLKKYGCGKQE